MRVLDLFSGIGGFSLGLERAGMRTVAFCEIDPYCRAVIARHWPGVPIFRDVRAVSGSEFGAVDLICGGFPCQDISLAGKGAGIDGELSGLWREFARLVGEVRPRYVIVENVAALLGRGISRVLGDLAALGFDAEWHCIPACAVGAPHRRDRVWVVAYADQRRCEGERIEEYSEQQGASWHQPDGCSAAGWRDGQDVADADVERCKGISRRREAGIAEHGEVVSDADIARLAQRESLAGNLREELAAIERGGQWLIEPDVGRVAHGIPARVDRLRALGNAIVPQVAEVIGRAIMIRE